MRTRTKTFDCVEMKQRAQERLRAEYEARKKEFSSFTEFINATAGESEFIREMRKKFGGPKLLQGAARGGDIGAWYQQPAFI